VNVGQIIADLRAKHIEPTFNGEYAMVLHPLFAALGMGNFSLKDSIFWKHWKHWSNKKYQSGQVHPPLSLAFYMRSDKIETRRSRQVIAQWERRKRDQ